MKAVNGYLENGYFIPMEEITFPERIQAVLVYDNTFIKDAVVNEEKEKRIAWLKEFSNAIKQSADEEMPDFPRVNLNRELVSLTDD